MIVDRWRPTQLASDGSQGRGESLSLRREVQLHDLLIKRGFLDYAKSRGDKRTSRRRKESSRAFAPRSRLVDQRSAFDAETIGMSSLGKIGSALRPPEQVERISRCGLGASLTQVTNEFGRDHAGTEARDERDRRSESLLVVLVG